MLWGREAGIEARGRFLGYFKYLEICELLDREGPRTAVRNIRQPHRGTIERGSVIPDRDTRSLPIKEQA